jgi:Transmembrane protein 131-like N-terminal
MLGLRRKERRAAAEASSKIIADLSGAAISGQVAVGENIVQIHAEHGAIVNYAPAGKRPVPRPRPLPIHRLPRDFPGLLGRERELDEARAAFQQRLPVEFCGEPGVGKSALLRHLAHRPGEEPQEGTIHVACEGEPVEDLLQFLFEAFFESDATMAPDGAELRGYLLERRALLIFDDFELGREELERLVNALPAAGFLTASTSRRLWGEGRSLRLGALEEPAAIGLLERELDRELSAAEQGAARRLCEALDGHPLRVLRAAALVRGGSASFDELAQASSTATAPARVTAVDRAAVAALSAPEREIFDLLGALPGLALHRDQVAAIAGIKEAGSLLEDLEDRGLVQCNSPRYSVAGGVEDAALVDPRRAAELRAAVRRHLARRLAAAPDPRRSLDEALTAAALLERGRDEDGENHSEQVLAAARAAEAPLALNGRWAAWAKVLHRALDAAERLPDRAATAWALHELGSRALCLGEAEAASAQLSKALALREELGDTAGAALTQHNLDRLSGGPPGPPTRTGPRVPHLPAILGVGAAIAVGAGAAVLAASGGGGGGTTTGRALSTGGGTHGQRTQVTTGGGGNGGQEVPPAAIQVSPTSLDFTSVELGSTTSKQVTVTNEGARTVSVAAAITGAVDGAFTSANGCTAAPHDGCQVAVTFAPPDLGPFSAELTISTATGGLGPIQLSGTGAPTPSTPSSTPSTPTPSIPTTTAPTTVPPTTSGPTTEPTTTPPIK